MQELPWCWEPTVSRALVDGHCPTAQLYKYTGTGTNSKWRLISANAQIVFPDPGINMVMFDQSGIGSPSALNYQIQSLDANSNVLYTSYTYPLSLTNTGVVFDIMNHFR